MPSSFQMSYSCELVTTHFGLSTIKYGSKFHRLPNISMWLKNFRLPNINVTQKFQIAKYQCDSKISDCQISMWLKNFRLPNVNVTQKFQIAKYQCGSKISDCQISMWLKNFRLPNINVAQEYGMVITAYPIFSILKFNVLRYGSLPCEWFFNINFHDQPKDILRICTTDIILRIAWEVTTMKYCQE